jgi:carnitine O-acetyltransferase
MGYVSSPYIFCLSFLLSSPDSFVQMSMLLAYYRLYGKIVCAYEPVLTKQFYHGRTEAMRTATPAAAEFCRVWMNHDSTKSEKLNSLRMATKEHSRLVKESANGKGGKLLIG